MQTRLFSLLCVWALLRGHDCLSDNFPKAQNVTWISLNFKTLLTWSPKPVDYSYTVQFNKQHGNTQTSPQCIQISETECDLTGELTDLKGRYMAVVQSVPVRGATSDQVEPPYTASAWFSPYQDTLISRPEFKIEESKDPMTITLHVEDVPTAIFNEQNKMMTIRDIFKDDLQYKVYYWKASSTGKKEKISQSIEIVMTGLDKGVSYCFTVQAFIPSRSIDKQLGELSRTNCSPERPDKPIFEEYSLAVLASAILVIIVIISVVIAVTVVCCKRQQKAKRREKVREPLRGV